MVTARNLDELVSAIAGASPRPTGLFVANDATTAQLYSLLGRHGMKVERDVTLVSCDNEQIRLSALHPRPASIDTGAEEVGFRAVVRLMSRMRRPDEPTIVVQVSLALSWAVLTEGALSFLGLSAQPPAPSWGTMLNAAQQFLDSAPWMAWWPGLAIFLLTLSFNLAGDGIRDVLDPKDTG